MLIEPPIDALLTEIATLPVTVVKTTSSTPFANTLPEVDFIFFLSLFSDFISVFELELLTKVATAPETATPLPPEPLNTTSTPSILLSVVNDISLVEVIFEFLT